MSYVQRKMIAVLAAAVFAVIYFPLQTFAFGLDLAVCASYTVSVFANAKRKRGKAAPLFTGEHAIPFVDVLFGHIVALAVLVGIVRLGVYAAPVLPAWLTTSIGSTPGGRHLPSALRYLQTFMVFFLGFVESWWLTAIRTTEEKEKNSRVMSKVAYEKHMDNRLRLGADSSNSPRPWPPGNKTRGSRVS